MQNGEVFDGHTQYEAPRSPEEIEQKMQAAYGMAREIGGNIKFEQTALLAVELYDTNLQPEDAARMSSAYEMAKRVGGVESTIHSAMLAVKIHKELSRLEAVKIEISS